MPTIKPGDVFFDKLPDGTYEKCVLQMTTEDTPDRHAAARGGTGEFYRPIPKEEMTPERIENADEIIMDVSSDDSSGIPAMVLLERINRS